MLHAASATDTFRLDSQFTHQDLLQQFEYLRVDQSQQLSDVLGNDNWSQQFDTSRLNDQQSLWMRVNLSNSNNQSIRLALSISNPSLDFIDVYLLDDKNRILSSSLVGAKRSIEQRPLNHRDFFFPFTLPQAEEVAVYVRVLDDGPMVFAANLWSEPQLFMEEQLHLAIIGVIGGALLIFGSGFLITYVMFRSPIRFWFALSALCFLLLVLNIQGIVVQLIDVGRYVSAITTGLMALLLFTTAKVNNNMLQKVPKHYRYLGYLFAWLTLATAFFFDSYWQIISMVCFAGASALLHLLFAWIFRHESNDLSNRLYALGWLVICAAAITQISLFLSAYISSFHLEMLFALAYMTGILLIGVAIEGHEQALMHSHQQQQRDTISSLRQFYDLFRNSAEGLYTARTNGELITVNLAMCQLFGFDSEQQMLQEVNNSNDLFANSYDQQHFVAQIVEQGRALRNEVKGKRRDGSERWFSVSGQLHQGSEEKYLVGTIVDITERKQSSISLEYLATHDSLTGVYNRREFEKRLSQALETALNEETNLALLYMDLDQFKVINDTCGHKAGDVLIKQLAQQLNRVVASKGMLARLGGDEFAVLLEDANAHNAYMIANKLLNVVQEFRFIWENRIFTLGISIGMVPWTDKVRSPEQLLSMADGACYMAKERGRNQIHLYSQEDEHMQRYESELTWVTHINKALKENQFELFYQHYRPLAKKAQGDTYEVLIRMLDEDGRLIPPSSFLPAAERYNLAAQIDRWVVEHYFSWLASNPEFKANLTRCNINLSGHSLADKDLKLFVLNAFEKYGIEYHKICFEITESMAIVKMDETLDFIKTFRQLGCAFALDDFGSGFSSYGYLKNLPVDFVKIDGGFVKDLLTDPIDMAMVSSIKDVAKAMGMQTVAEFVESKEIMVELGKMGVDYAQGYGVAKPMSLREFQPFVVTEQ